LRLLRRVLNVLVDNDVAVVVDDDDTARRLLVLVLVFLLVFVLVDPAVPVIDAVLSSPPPLNIDTTTVDSLDASVGDPISTDNRRSTTAIVATKDV